MNACQHPNVEVHTRITSCATHEEPETLDQWGECNDCGKTLDLSDISDAHLADGEEEMPVRGLPSEFFD